MAFETIYNGVALPSASTPAWSKTADSNVSYLLEYGGYHFYGTDPESDIMYELVDNTLSSTTGYTFEWTGSCASLDTLENRASTLAFYLNDDTYGTEIVMCSDGIEINSNASVQVLCDTSKEHTYRVTRKGTDLQFFQDNLLKASLTVSGATAENFGFIFEGYGMFDVLLQNIKLDKTDAIAPTAELQGWTTLYRADATPANSAPAWTANYTIGTEEITEGGYYHHTSVEGDGAGYRMTDGTLSNTTGVTVEMRMKMLSHQNFDGFAGTSGFAGLLLRAGNGASDKSSSFAIFADGIYDYAGYGEGSASYVMDTTDDYHTYRLTMKDGVTKVYVDGLERMTLGCIDDAGNHLLELLLDDMGVAGVEVSVDYIAINNTSAIAPEWTVEYKGELNPLVAQPAHVLSTGALQLGETVAEGFHIHQYDTPIVYDFFQNAFTSAGGLTWEGRLKVTTATNQGDVFVLFWNDNYAYQLDFYTDRVEMVMGLAEARSYNLNATALHTYRLTLINQAVVLYVDGIQAFTGTQSGTTGTGSPFIEFGSANSAEADSTWEYLKWNTNGAFEPTSPNVAPDKPSLTAPINEATGVSINPTLTSSAFNDTNVGDTHRASQWQISENINFSTFSYDSGTTTTEKTSISISAPEDALDYSTVYYAHVRHQDNSEAWSDYSDTISFTTEAPPNVAPDKPSITSPTALEMGVSVTPTFTSSAFNDTNIGDTHKATQWQIYSDEAMTSIVYDSGWDEVNLTSIAIADIPDNFDEVGRTKLDAGTIYYAHVRYQDNNDEWSVYSDAVTFTTNVNPLVPAITSPSADETGVSLTPTITSSPFSDINLADTHKATQWQISTLLPFPETTFYDSGEDTINLTSIAIADIPDNFEEVGRVALDSLTQYFVRVRYQDSDNNWSEFSPVVSFRTLLPLSPHIAKPSDYW